MKKIIIPIVIIFLSAPFCSALTVGQIKTEIRREINDTDSSDYRNSDGVILDLINQGQREIVNMTWLAERTTSYTLTARTTYYNLPQDFLAANQVIFRNSSGQSTKLEQAHARSLYQKNTDWEKQAGAPFSYYVSLQTAPVTTSSNTLRISYIPIPTNTSTGTVTIWYASQVQDVAADGDIPFDGRTNFFQYHYALVYYVSMRIKIQEGVTDEAKLYSDLFGMSVAALKDRTGQMPDYNPSFSVGDR